MQTNNHKVEILMATYNGENYIVEQIESLRNQTYTDWNLLIRDDGSNDGTIKIIEYYEKKYPEKIKLLRDNKKNLGVQYNFLELLEYSTQDYIMFCDQDDIWLENKIEKTLKKMLLNEKKEMPTLIYTDLKVVDKNLNIIHDSFWKYQNIDILNNNYEKLIIENNITGCTVMINKRLKELALGKKFKNVIMHDWLFGLLASLKGEIYLLDESLILYRQHGSNCAGAKKNKENLNDLIKKVFILKRQLLDAKKQANDILNKIELPTDRRKKILEYVNLKNKSFFKRKIWLIKNKFIFQNKFIKKIIQLVIE